ncbi:MAG: hypothetical protein Q9187_006596 [Circinaria calcarea]
MPSHLHPRSRFTTSLFGTTLLVSFLVVGMPHILPCPAPRAEFADVEIMEDGRRRRRRRRMNGDTRVVECAQDDWKLDEATLRELAVEEELFRRKTHECPVPKPKVIVGRVFGLEQPKRQDSDNAAKPNTK